MKNKQSQQRKLIQIQNSNKKEKVNLCKKDTSRIGSVINKTHNKNQQLPVAKPITQIQPKLPLIINYENSSKPKNTNKQMQQKPITDLQKQNDKVENNNYPNAILLGAPGVGKTFIMHKLFPKEKNIKEFMLYKLSLLEYNFVDTVGFDFERDIQMREAQIKMFKEFFIQVNNRISSIFIVVNFERTDLMKKKLISVYKYFRKFTNLISIVVTDFHLSESNEDEENLIKSLKIFQPNDVLFVRGDVKPEELTNQLKKKQSKIIKKINQFNQLNLKDTIFEQDDLEEQNILRTQLLKKMINK
ncbi:unnamed protein product (macronuclear) [Paramecium tetraurelia]|uniref:P-loop containing nucleoside triphosphate hydrolase n=1 Tax=Paramecium tetraurelia TaxID=5888 RepID=A0BWG7_PARTE|nr:uncharacterized protein GSPATT00032736001 [Paramecium tetraurelia]CAK62884.1 unnamed protein product [Paramecium tetraurelia]|eukprot:XP_001430282.1 hypothetical protein (macronuclear) [Paramecium tetraurelia strain d4-2]